MRQNKIFSFKDQSIILIYFSIVTLLIHLYSNAFANYGIFRDELYYLACANRLDLGYVDHPPLSIYLLAFIRSLIGDSVFALRLTPAIAHALTVLFTGFMVCKMKGGLTATIIAALSVMLAPILLGMNTIYSMNCIGILLWAIGAYICILIIEESTPKRWILLGIIIGIGALNKIDFLWFGFGVFMGLIFTEQRKHLKTLWPYIAALIAIIIFTPYIIWNINNNYAHLEFIRNASLGKYSSLTRLSFLITNILILNPFSMLVWLPGIYFYFFNKNGKIFKMLGIIYLSVFLILFINAHSKAEYLSSAYPILFAGGGIMIENLSQIKKWGFIKYAISILILITGILLAPSVLPILSTKAFISYTNSLGLKPTSSENKKLIEFPQFFADMFGWEDMARSVSLVNNSLLTLEKEGAVIIARNYGEAGAMEYYRNKYKLPPVISFHNNYWIWSLEQSKKSYTTFIVMGGNLQDHLKSCEFVEISAIHSSRYSMPYENNMIIYICKNLKKPIEDILRENKHFE